MSRYLLIDIGAGTMDVLWYDDDADLHYKAVVRSPVRSLADRIAGIEGDVLVTGGEMGGGPVSTVLRQRAESARVVMTRSAAATIHHDLDRVRSHGIEIVEDEQADALRSEAGLHELALGDVDVGRLRDIVETFDVPLAFDAVGVCLQDHGVPPAGVSHLDYRHTMFRERLDGDPYPHTLLYAADEVPETLNRLRTAAADAAGLPSDEIYVMDSGMAAILGASRDPQRRGKRCVLVLDVATSHSVGAAFDGHELCGFFEYHTRDITVEKLDELLVNLAEGRLEHDRILREGGHGAYCRKAIGFENVEIILATGPRRGRIVGSRHPIALGSPLGDNMMTGTFGLLEAIRQRKGLAPIDAY